MSETSDAPRALEQALRKRLSLIADREWFQRDASGHLEALKGISETISNLSTQLPQPVHPQLRHYLERCSYDKALAFLSGSPQDPHSS